MLPGLIDGEERMVGYYEEAIAESQSGSPEEVMLVQQRDVVRHKIVQDIVEAYRRFGERRERAAQ